METLTIEELLARYASEKAVFNKEEPVSVSMHADFEVDTHAEVSANRQGMTKVVARAYHDQTNLNGSTIDSDVFKKNTESVKLRPILANVVVDENGVADFGAHDMDIDISDEGVLSVRYLEAPVGVIEDYDFEFDTEAMVTRAVVNGYIYDEYKSEVVDILKRRQRVDCSVELCIREMHYDIDQNLLFLDDYYIEGLTLLGESHMPGMAGSSVSVFEEGVRKYPADPDDGAVTSKEDEPEQQPEPHAEPINIDGTPVEVSGPSDEAAPSDEAPTEDEAENNELSDDEAADKEPEEQETSQEEDSEDEDPQENEAEDSKPEEGTDEEFILLEELAKYDSELEGLEWVLLDYADEDDRSNGFAYFMCDDGVHAAEYDLNAEEVIEKTYRVTFVQTDFYTLLLREINSLMDENEQLKASLESYELAKDEEAKAAIMAEALYAPYWERASFAAIKEQAPSMKAAELEQALALAYVNEKRTSITPKDASKKVFRNTKDEGFDKEVERLGRRFVEIKNKNKE